VIHKFSAIPIKIPMRFFKEIEKKKKKSPKIHMETQKLQTAKAILSKKNNVGGPIIPNSNYTAKLY
jgi:hypothetical protein